MIKNDKIYHIVSICSLVLHICVFVFVIIVAFLPFHEKRNFYESFIGFFGNSLSFIQPYFVMMILFLSCLGAVFAIKRPMFSFMTVVCSVSFFVIAVLPYSIEAMIVGFASPWISGSMSIFGIGFDLIMAASYIFYFDIAFFIYSLITSFIRSKTILNIFCKNLWL